MVDQEDMSPLFSGGRALKLQWDDIFILDVFLLPSAFTFRNWATPIQSGFA